jgi:hypothetical protein
MKCFVYFLKNFFSKGYMVKIKVISCLLYKYIILTYSAIKEKSLSSFKNRPCFHLINSGNMCLISEC